MLKLFENQQVSLYKIQNDLGLDHMRLYRYAEGILSIDNMPVTLILQLSNYFKIEPNKLFMEMKEYARKNKRRSN